jgi:hypothetical protein
VQLNCATEFACAKISSVAGRRQTPVFDLKISILTARADCLALRQPQSDAVQNVCMMQYFIARSDRNDCKAAERRIANWQKADVRQLNARKNSI